MDKTYFAILVWSLILAYLADEIKGQCTTDTDCPDDNTVCVSGYCQCEQGFTILNGNCAQVVGRLCLDNRDCDDGRTECANSKCQCRSMEWREDSGKCISYFGKTCKTWSDCGFSLGYECINSVCRCSPGYKFTNVSCVKVLGNACNPYTDDVQCPLENSVCRTYNHYCTCDYCCTEKDNICKPVLGSSCDDVACGNHLHHSYGYLTGGAWSAEEWSYFKSYHLHMTCNTDNVCSCNHGFIADGIFCTPVVGRQCSNNNGCGTNPGYTCNLQTYTCDCSTNFHPHIEIWHEMNNISDINYNYWWYWWYGNKQDHVTLCIPEIGQNCSTVNCSVENALCNELDQCVCAVGYTETKTGACQQVLGMPCVRETLCQIVDGGTCGDHNVCVCKEGYLQNGQLCGKVLGSSCSSDSNCQMSNSVCVSGICTCANGFTESNFRCLREECAVHVRYLPDIHRRFVHRKLVDEEQIIDDSLLEEGWYSLGKHNLHASKTGPEQGNCSTYYPIYMTETLTASQIENLKTGNLTISTTVGRHNSYEGSENITIKMRKCGMETHIYIKPLKIHFSGFCLSREQISSPTRYKRLHAYVFPDLLFERKQVDNRTKYKPYLVFSCLPLEVKIHINAIYSLYPHSIFQNNHDNFFFYVHWYLDDIHFKSIGPVRRKHFITGTSLFESEILDAGFKLGFEIRCSIEITDDANGQIALLANSKSYSTRVQEIFAFLHGSQTHNIRSLYSIRIPYGCETFEEDDHTYCELEWPIIGENGGAICNITQSGHTDRKKCGFALRGYTYKGYVNRTSSWSNEYQHYYNYFYYSNDTHTISIHDYFYTVIDSQYGSEGWDFKIKLTSPNTSTGHKLWDGYRLPVANGHISHWNYYSYGYCSFHFTNVPVITTQRQTSNEYMWASVVIDTVGEFLLFRSRTLPVEIHIQTEECKYGDRRICVCGLTYRNGGDIYLFSYCNGIRRRKLVTGDKKPREYDPDIPIVLINGIQFYWSSYYWYTYYSKELENIYLHTTNGKETLHSGEGLCTFLSGSYTHRNGAKMSTSEGFVSSWRLPVEESLHHPRNHKGFSWSHEYLLCSCPLNAKDREVYNHYNYTYGNHTRIEEYANVYHGHFQCSTENSCSTETDGEEWPDSLLPSIATKEVTARMEIRFNGNWPLLHLFCDFKTQKEYFYQIQWKLDGEIINRTAIMSANVAEEFYITNDDIFTSKFLLEAGFSCEVSVYNDSQNLLLGGMTSEEIKAVEFVKTGVELRRGGDVTIQMKFNVPLVCMKNTPCTFELKFFDPKEKHNCLDSTIAIRNQHTCGKRITGVHSQADLVFKESLVNITLTTKNNDLYMLRNTFNVKLRIVASRATSTFMTGPFRQQVTIFVRDDDRYWQGNYCYANNDPRMRTFDGQYYSNMLVDEFIMMKHKRLPVEVQVETIYGWYSCGVTVRAGRDVFTINHCHGDHVTGYLLADDKILRVRKRDEHRYQIYLPHGTMVDVMISSWANYMVNVYIYPSPADMKEVEGLCGNFDGNIYGDLIHSDGKVTSGYNYYWWWWWYIYDAEDFIRSWGLRSTNTTKRSLTDIDIIEKTLESWRVSDVLCVCTGNDGNGEVKCSASEQGTCVSPVNKPGEIVTIKPRQKRSGHVLDKEYKQRMRKMKESRDAYHTSTTRIIRPRSTGDLEAAINDCNRTLSSKCGIMTVKDTGLNVTFEELIYNCGQDRALNPDTDWSALTCQAMEANVEKELLADIQFKENNSDIVASILENLCVGNCSGNGICVKGVCECFSGFRASDCSLDLSKRVKIIGRTGDGICDINKYDCTCIRLTTSGSSNTSLYTLQHEQYSTDGVWTTVGTSNGTVEYDNFYEVFVCPEISRTERSTSNTSTIADQYIIALSNDGISFGNSSTIFVLDSMCLTVNQISGSPTIELLPGFCIIGGICYARNVHLSTDACLFCDEILNPYEWTRDKKDSCSDAEMVDPSGDTGIQPLHLGIIAGAAGVLVVVVIVVLVACIVKKKHSSRVSVWDGSLYNSPKNTAFQPYELRKEVKTS